MARKKATNKKVKPDFATRIGRFTGNTLPGSAKRLGRWTKRVAIHTADASQRFGKAFKEGYEEV